MIKINNLETLNNLLKGYIKKGIYTNNFVRPSSYKVIIDNGDLYYKNIESGVLLFEDRNNFWQVYYYLKDLESKLDLTTDKPVNIEKPYQADKDNPILEMNYFEAQGFVMTMKRHRMTANSVEFMQDNDLKALSNGNFCRYAQAEQLNKICELLKANFNPYYGYIPLEKEISSSINEKEIFCELDDKGKILGLLHITKNHLIYYVLHIIVIKEARNKQIAKKLLSQLVYIVKDNEKAKIRLWVNEGNEAARYLYKSLGFKYDVWQSFVMIKK